MECSLLPNGYFLGHFYGQIALLLKYFSTQYFLHTAKRVNFKHSLVQFKSLNKLSLPSAAVVKSRKRVRVAQAALKNIMVSLWICLAGFLVCFSCAVFKTFYFVAEKRIEFIVWCLVILMSLLFDYDIVNSRFSNLLFVTVPESRYK